LQSRHQLGIVAVQLNDLVGLLVGGGDQAQGLVHAPGVQAQVVAAGDLAHHQPDQHALAGRVQEALVRVLRHLGLRPALATGLLDGLLQHGAGLALDQLRRHFDRAEGGHQVLADLAPQAVHQRALELALQVGADVRAELLEFAAPDAEAADERLVDLRQHLLGDLLDLHVDLRRLAGQLRHAPVGREGDVDGLLVAAGHAGQRVLDVRVHAAGADHGHAALGALGRQALVADLRPGLHVHRVAFLRRARHRGPAAALRAQVLDHAVDVGLGHLGRVAGDVELRHVDLAEVGHDLEGGHVRQLLVAGVPAALDAGAAGQAQLVLADRLVEALAQHAVQDLVAHLLSEALLDDPGRHLAGTKTLDADRARDLAQATSDLVLEALRRQAERHAALEIAQGFDRCLHTHSCSPRGPRGD